MIFTTRIAAAVVLAPLALLVPSSPSSADFPDPPGTSLPSPDTTVVPTPDTLPPDTMEGAPPADPADPGDPGDPGDTRGPNPYDHGEFFITAGDCVRDYIGQYYWTTDYYTVSVAWEGNVATITFTESPMYLPWADGVQRVVTYVDETFGCDAPAPTTPTWSCEGPLVDPGIPVFAPYGPEGWDLIPPGGSYSDNYWTYSFDGRVVVATPRDGYHANPVTFENTAEGCGSATEPTTSATTAVTTVASPPTSPQTLGVLPETGTEASAITARAAAAVLGAGLALLLLARLRRGTC